MHPGSVTALDFDADGVDDLIVVSINKNATLSWRYQSSKTDRLTAIGRFGTVGQQLIPGIWGTTLQPIVATISNSNTNETQWNFKQHKSSSDTPKIAPFLFGGIDSLSLSGADFDGDKIFEAVSIEFQDGSLLWKRYNTTLEGEAAFTNTVFGLKGDIPFLWNIPNAPSQYAIFKNNHTANGTIEILDNASQITVVSLNKAPRYSEPPQTFAVGNAIYIVFISREYNKTILNFYRSSGALHRSVTVSGTGDVVLGNFSKTIKGQEVAIHSGKNLYITSPLTSRVVRRKSFSGIPVDTLNSNSVGSFDNTIEDVLSASCGRMNPNDGYKRGFVWKPNSDTQRFAVAVLPHEFFGSTKDVEMFRADTGEYIRSIRSKGCSNPDDQGVRCAYQERLLTGQEYRALYNEVLLKAYRKDGSCAVFKLSNPAQRID